MNYAAAAAALRDMMLAEKQSQALYFRQQAHLCRCELEYDLAAAYEQDYAEAIAEIAALKDQQ